MIVFIPVILFSTVIFCSFSLLPVHSVQFLSILFTVVCMLYSVYCPVFCLFHSVDGIAFHDSVLFLYSVSGSHIQSKSGNPPFLFGLFSAFPFEVSDGFIQTGFVQGV